MKEDDSQVLDTSDDLDELFESIMNVVTDKRAKYNEYRKQWRKDNPDKTKAQQQRHYYNNQEKEINRVKKYNREHRDEKLAYQKKYYEENADKLIEQSGLWKRRNKDKVRVYHIRKHLKIKYRITLEEYLEMNDSQKGLCAICGNLPDAKRSLGVDHCHTTGKVRALLCHSCNVGLGNFKENIETMIKAIEYLKYYRGG